MAVSFPFFFPALGDFGLGWLAVGGGMIWASIFRDGLEVQNKETINSQQREC